MYNSPYIPNYSNGYNQQINNIPQTNNYDEYIKYLDKEKERVEKSKEQYINRYQQQPTSINQTFQLAPNNANGIKHINSIEDVEKELTVVETAFVTNDYTQLFIKNAKGEIRTFVMEEIVPKDEKDKIIEQLRLENEELKGMISNESTNTTNDEQGNTTIDKPTKTKTTSNVSVSRTSKAKSK